MSPAIQCAQSLNIKRLYHYQSFEKPERLAQIFIEKKLYFGGLEQLNDPWDCRPFFDTSSLGDPRIRERTIEWTLDASRKVAGSMPESVRRERADRLRADPALLEQCIREVTIQNYESFKRQYRVYCLSKHADSTLMWAHYGASCGGVCLEFSAQNHFLGRALEVQYEEAFPALDIAETDDLENSKVFMTKSAVWRYEDEFRLVACQHPYHYEDLPVANHGFVPFPPEILKSVILGPLMTKEQRLLVNQIVRRSGWSVDLKEAVILPDRYGFEIRDFKRD